MREPDVQWHRFRPEARTTSGLIRASVIIVYAGLPFMCMLLSRSGSSFLVLLLIMALPLLVFAAVPLAGLLITSADIALDVDGVQVQIMGPLRVGIPWEQLRYAAIWEIAPPQHISALLLRQWEAVSAVYVPGSDWLTPAGLTYGLGRVPVFIITPDHEHYQGLIRRLEHIHHPLNRPQRPAPWTAPPRDE